MNRIAFVGFGLLASSIAQALKQEKSPTIIRAVSSSNTLEKVRELKLADEFFEYEQVEEWASDCDLILLCSPILHILKTIEALSKISFSSTVNKTCLVSDIGSTKVEICKAGEKLSYPFTFVGSHPMAGSEKRTCEHNDPSIFENAYWFICPSKDIKESVYAPLLNLIKFLGANSIILSSEEHDKTMAWVSHMPQLLSSTLAASMPEHLISCNYQHYAGRAFRDMTRIAASGWGMWHDIVLTNRDEIILALEDIQKGVNNTIAATKSIVSLEKQVSTDDASEQLESIFKKGNAGRASLFKKGRNATNDFYELTIQLKDKPGALLSVFEPLAEEGLNIRDIELMKVRENVAGTLLVAFKTQDEVIKAKKILNYLGYEVKER